MGSSLNMASSKAHLERQGEIMQMWVENTGPFKCPIRKSRLCFEFLQGSGKWTAYMNSIYLDEKWTSWADGMGMVSTDTEEEHGGQIYEAIVSKYTRQLPTLTRWEGRIGRGVIVTDKFRREKGSGDPYMSDIMKSVYEFHFPIESLKHVVFASVIEKATYGFITSELYGPHRSYTPLDEPRMWENPSPEFRGILGTPIGKVAGSFVIGAYGRGLKRIVRIVTFYTDYALNVQFDLEYLR